MLLSFRSKFPLAGMKSKMKRARPSWWCKTWQRLTRACITARRCMALARQWVLWSWGSVVESNSIFTVMNNDFYSEWWSLIWINLLIIQICFAEILSVGFMIIFLVVQYLIFQLSLNQKNVKTSSITAVGHHLLGAPEALLRHRGRSDRPGRRHHALWEKSVQESPHSR